MNCDAIALGTHPLGLAIPTRYLTLPRVRRVKTGYPASSVMIISFVKSRRSSRTTSKNSNRELIAYQISRKETAPLVPAPCRRKWMDDVAVNFSYRCLPLTMANQYGWEILSTRRVRATWNGRSCPEGIRVKTLCGGGGIHCLSHFGAGVLTFTLPFVFRTPPGWNLMVRGPANSPKDGLIALDGIVETDWAHATFTMNWRFTRACTVEFAVGEPICQLFPIERDTIGTFKPQVRMLRSNRKLHRRYLAWAASRKEFIRRLKKNDRDAVKQGWQKHYMRAAIEKKPSVQPL